MIPIRGLRAPVIVRPPEPEPASLYKHPSGRLIERVFWTHDQDEILRRMWGDQPASKIAEAIGPRFSKNSVIARAHRLKLPKLPSPIGQKRAEPTKQQEHAVQRAGRIYAVLKECARQGEVCPSNSMLAVRFDCGTSSIVNALHFLEATGMIEVRRGNDRRVVTIAATGDRTAGTIRRTRWCSEAACAA